MSCRCEVKIDLADERIRRRCFARAHFRCTETIQPYTAQPPRTCGQPGHLYIKPRELLQVGGPVRWRSFSAGSASRTVRLTRPSSTNRRGRHPTSSPAIAIVALAAAVASTGTSMGWRNGRPDDTGLHLHACRLGTRSALG